MTDGTPNGGFSRRDFLRAVTIAGVVAPVALTYGCGTDSNWNLMAPVLRPSSASSETEGGSQSEYPSETPSETPSEDPGEGGGSPNTAPVVQALDDAELIVGESYAATGSFADAEGGAFTATVAWGDGNAGPLALDGSTFALNHLYAAAGAYTVTVTVTDEGDLPGASSAAVTVLSAAGAASNLASQIASLVSSGAVAANTANPWLSSLSAALASLTRGNANSARGQLGAVRNQIAAAVKSRKLDAASAAALDAYLARILAAIA